jgi:molybdate transport system substrate-binding protein
LTDALGEISEMYSTHAPNVKLRFIFGSSGTLQTQIEEGAPSDIFISAARKQMTTLNDKGLILSDTYKELLVNKVVLIVLKDSVKSINSFEDAGTDKVLKVALGEPKGVPVGQYSEEIFSYLNITAKLKEKAVYATDVRQVLNWVESGDVDCGVVYATDAAISDKVKVVDQAPEGSHEPVIYPAVILKSSRKAYEAKKFLDYLSTDESRGVFEKYGFNTN